MMRVKPTALRPLRQHANGQWFTTKRIGGRKRFFYFGTDRERANALYHQAAPSLMAGRPPVPPATPADAITLYEVADRFLIHVQSRVEAGEIGLRQFDALRRACATFVAFVGEDVPAALVTPQRLAEFRAYLQQRYGVNATNRTLTNAKAMLRWAYRRAKLIRVALHEDDALAKVRVKVARRERRMREEAAGGSMTFTPGECRILVDAAKEDPALLCFVLLGLNAGFGPTDCSELPLSAVNLDTGRVDWVRPKTEEVRQLYLWEVTREAIRGFLAVRPEPTEEGAEGLVFVTRFGRRWVRETVTGGDGGGIGAVNPNDEIGKAFTKLQARLVAECDSGGRPLRRRGRGFYSLRRTFATVANDTLDKDAIRRVMGWSLQGMDPHYVRQIPEQRLLAVADYVWRRLFAPAGSDSSGEVNK